MGFGPIREPNNNDVLCGRGGLINGSPGNVQFRTIVSKRKKEYNAKETKRQMKAHIAAEIVRHIRGMNPSGRFLREDANGLWFDVGDARAIRKTGQALREAAPAIRQDGEEGEDNTNPVENNQDDKASDSGSSDDGKKEETQPAEKKKGSPKRKKKELTKETKKETIEMAHQKTTTADKTPIEEAKPRSSDKSGKKNWFPNMMGGMRRSNNPSNNNNSDAASVAAETVRSSQTYLIPQSAVGPHITNAPGVAMPRMSPGAVFSNSHHGARHRSSATEHPPPPYPHQQAHYAAYPYAHYNMPPMYPPMPHPHNLHHHNQPYHHQPQHAGGPYPQSAAPVPMVPVHGSMPREISDDAFGMNFFPTKDVTMRTPSEIGSNCTVSDISGLSSTMTPKGEQRKLPVIFKKPQAHAHTPPIMNNESMGPPPPPTSSGIQSLGDASMLDTTSSLPSFSDILDDVDMASATSGGASGFSISSSSVAKMMGPPAPQVPNNNNNNKLGGGSSLPRAGDMTMKENSTGSCLSGKSGSCLSGKSEISLPSSCGTALSQFSDSFMALHLSDNHDLE